MRKSIRKLRRSDHKLEAEVGRHKKITRDKRVCRLCPNEIETETRFLSSYKTLREKIFNEVINASLGQDILACEEKTIRLGGYILKASKIREPTIDTMNERMLKYLLDRGFVVVDYVVVD